MAQLPKRKIAEKKQLIEQLERTRTQLKGDLGNIQQNLDISKHLESTGKRLEVTIKKHPGTSMAASVVVGLLLSSFAPRSRSVPLLAAHSAYPPLPPQKKAAFSLSKPLFGILKIAFTTAALPLIKKALRKKLDDMVGH